MQRQEAFAEKLEVAPEAVEGPPPPPVITPVEEKEPVLEAAPEEAGLAEEEELEFGEEAGAVAEEVVSEPEMKPEEVFRPVEVKEEAPPAPPPPTERPVMAPPPPPPPPPPPTEKPVMAPLPPPPPPPPAPQESPEAYAGASAEGVEEQAETEPDVAVIAGCRIRIEIPPHIAEQTVGAGVDQKRKVAGVLAAQTLEKNPQLTASPTVDPVSIWSEILTVIMKRLEA